METMLLGCSPKQRYSGQDRRRRSFSLLSPILSLNRSNYQQQVAATLSFPKKLTRYENKRRGKKETFVYLGWRGKCFFKFVIIAATDFVGGSIPLFPFLPKIETLAWKEEEEEEEDGGICQGLLGRNASSPFFFFFFPFVSRIS